jgi:hypothetical protein
MESIFQSPLDPTILPSLLLVAVLAWIMLAPREPPSFWRQFRHQLDQLGNELDRRIDRERWVRRLPVFSAETVRGKEAELLRERLPRKAPRARFVLLLFLIGVLVWWSTRQLM